MAAGWGRWQAYEKTSITKISYLSLSRFTGQVQFKGVRATATGSTRARVSWRRPRPPLYNHPAQPHFSSTASGR